MQAFANLQAGPRHKPASQSRVWPLLACTPLLLLCLAALAACVTGLATLNPQAALTWAEQAIPRAAAATLACLVLAIAPAASGAGLLWLLPLWLAPAAGVLGWSLLPLPPGPATDVARATVLTLPLMVLLLSGAWSAVPAGLNQTAACLGAPPATRLAMHMGRHMPGTARACLVVFALCLALAGPAASLSPTP